MYERFFGLDELPFQLTPDPRYLFLSAKHREALGHLVFGIREGAGFVAITGEIGAGKTTLLRTLLRQSDGATKYAYILNPVLTGVELLQEINHELGIVDAGTRRELLLALNQHLLDQKAAGRRVVLVIDEAQALDGAVLEQLRLLSNFETETAKLLQIVLVGQPELHDLLTRPDLEQLNQRITVRWHLGRLDRDEAAQYIAHRLATAAGGRPREIFTRGALSEIYAYSRGVPRLINIVCHRALLVAYAADRTRVTRSLARRAVRELRRHLPVRGRRATSPWVWPVAAGLAVALAAGGALGWRAGVFAPRGADRTAADAGADGGATAARLARQDNSAAPAAAPGEAPAGGGPTVAAGDTAAIAGGPAVPAPPAAGANLALAGASGAPGSAAAAAGQGGAPGSPGGAVAAAAGAAPAAGSAAVAGSASIAGSAAIASAGGAGAPGGAPSAAAAAPGAAGAAGGSDGAPTQLASLPPPGAGPAAAGEPAVDPAAPGAAAAAALDASAPGEAPLAPAAIERATLNDALRQVSPGNSAYEATEALLRVWGVPALTPQEAASRALDLPSIARSRGLEYLTVNGNLSLLRVLDLPAILEVAPDDASDWRFVTLDRLDDDGADLVVGRDRVSVSNGVLAEAWYGKAHVLWRDLDRLGPVLAVGAVKPEVRRLHALLRDAGAYDGLDSPTFSPATEAAVLRFQRGRRLLPDGKAGPMTIVALYQAVAGDRVPHLARSAPAAPAVAPAAGSAASAPAVPSSAPAPAAAPAPASPVVPAPARPAGAAAPPHRATPVSSQAAARDARLGAAAGGPR